MAPNASASLTPGTACGVREVASVSPAVDVFSPGTIAYTVLVGRDSPVLSFRVFRTLRAEFFHSSAGALAAFVFTPSGNSVCHWGAAPTCAHQAPSGVLRTI